MARRDRAVRAAAGNRRCRFRQDQHAGASVAHLIVEGADPRRILLMTFSRRAASEMTKRVERIARQSGWATMPAS